MSFVKSCVIFFILSITLFSCARREHNIYHGKKRAKYLNSIKDDFYMSGTARIEGVKGFWNIDLSNGNGILKIKGPLGFFKRSFPVKNVTVFYEGKNIDVSLFLLGFAERRKYSGRLLLGADNMPDSLIKDNTKVIWLNYKRFNRVYLPSNILLIYEGDTAYLKIGEIHVKE